MSFPDNEIERKNLAQVTTARTLEELNRIRSTLNTAKNVLEKNTQEGDLFGGDKGRKLEDINGSITAITSSMDKVGVLATQNGLGLGRGSKKEQTSGRSPGLGSSSSDDSSDDSDDCNSLTADS